MIINIGIPIVIPVKARGFINQGSGLGIMWWFPKIMGP